MNQLLFATTGGVSSFSRKRDRALGEDALGDDFENKKILCLDDLSMLSLHSPTTYNQVQDCYRPSHQQQEQQIQQYTVSPHDSEVIHEGDEQQLDESDDRPPPSPPPPPSAVVPVGEFTPFPLGAKKKYSNMADILIEDIIRKNRKTALPAPHTFGEDPSLSIPTSGPQPTCDHVLTPPWRNRSSIVLPPSAASAVAAAEAAIWNIDTSDAIEDEVSRLTSSAKIAERSSRVNSTRLAREEQNRWKMLMLTNGSGSGNSSPRYNSDDRFSGRSAPLRDAPHLSNTITHREWGIEELEDEVKQPSSTGVEETLSVASATATAIPDGEEEVCDEGAIFDSNSWGELYDDGTGSLEQADPYIYSQPQQQPESHNLVFGTRQTPQFSKESPFKFS